MSGYGRSADPCETFSVISIPGRASLGGLAGTELSIGNRADGSTAGQRLAEDADVSAGRMYQHANRGVLVEGDLLPVRLRRSGMAIDAR